LKGSFLLSLNLKGLPTKSFFSRITEAETTGPARDPRPASSIPTMFLNPYLNNSSSIDE